MLYLLSEPLMFTRGKWGRMYQFYVPLSAQSNGHDAPIIQKRHQKIQESCIFQIVNKIRKNKE